MKKRVLSGLLALCMTAALLVLPAGAAEQNRFSDVAGTRTAVQAETLRLMGVMDGYADGSFRPQVSLNRAQFCKMATYAMHNQQKLGLYRTVTVFPDVKPSHWAAAYINLASRTTADGGTVKEGEAHIQTIIAGFPDGKFHPERTITLGQATTILLRILGYQDSQVGGVWPDSYMATGRIAGLLDGLPDNGYALVTRAQAAQLFVNLLEAKTPGGGTLYPIGEETELLGVDGASGALRLSEGQTIPMAEPVADTTLAGSRGRVVTLNDRALTFLPTTESGVDSAAGAVVIHSSGSTAGLEALAGNSTYQLFKNGSPATAADLRAYDVATYYPATNSILVCDTRVSVFYEACEPNPQKPAKIQVLNGTRLQVLPTAVDTVAQFRPGEQMILLLTADGRVAGAVKPGTAGVRANAIGLVQEDGVVQLFCGAGTVTLAEKAQNLLGKVVQISAVQRNKVTLTEARTYRPGTLNVAEKTLDGKPLADRVTIMEDGKRISLSKITTAVVPEEQIRYARVNWAGEVDLLVLARTDHEFYGRVFWITEKVQGENGPEKIRKLGVETGNGQQTETFKMSYEVSEGDMVVARINRGGTGFSLMQKLTAMENVSWSSWVRDDLVNAGGKSWAVSPEVKCYNRDSRSWVSLNQARAYADTATVYVEDGVVRIVEVCSAR